MILIYQTIMSFVVGKNYKIVSNGRTSSILGPFVRTDTIVKKEINDEHSRTYEPRSTKINYIFELDTIPESKIASITVEEATQQEYAAAKVAQELIKSDKVILDKIYDERVLNQKIITTSARNDMIGKNVIFYDNAVDLMSYPSSYTKIIGKGVVIKLTTDNSKNITSMSVIDDPDNPMREDQFFFINMNSAGDNRRTPRFYALKFVTDNSSSSSSSVAPATLYTITKIISGNPGSYGNQTSGPDIYDTEVIYKFTIDQDLEELWKNQGNSLNQTNSLKIKTIWDLPPHDLFLKRICDILDTYYYGVNVPHITKTAWDGYMSDRALAPKLLNGVNEAKKKRKQAEDDQRELSVNAKRQSALALPMTERLFKYMGDKNDYYFKVSEGLVDQLKPDLELFKWSSDNRFIADRSEIMNSNLKPLMLFADKNKTIEMTDATPLQLNEALYAQFLEEKEKTQAAERDEKNVARWSRDKFWNWMDNFFKDDTIFSSYDGGISINYENCLDLLEKLTLYYPGHKEPETINGTTYYLTFKIRDSDKNKGVKDKCSFAMPDGTWALLKKELESNFKKMRKKAGSQQIYTEKGRTQYAMLSENEAMLNEIYKHITKEREICSYKSAAASSVKSFFGIGKDKKAASFDEGNKETSPLLGKDKNVGGGKSRRGRKSRRTKRSSRKRATRKRNTRKRATRKRSNRKTRK
jgi:hypothetical protein